MGFDFPEAFLLLLILPPLLWVLRRGERRAKEVAQIFKSQPPRPWYFIGRLVLVSLFIGSLAVVGARPYLEPKETGDFVFISDVSRSMTARHSCGEPTFLARSKQVMRAVLSGVPEGKFGIIAFDRFAFPLTQMTYDHAYLDEVIEHGLFVGLFFEATATEVEKALSVVAQKKKRLPEIYGNVEHVILLSDGHVAGDYQRRFRQPLLDLQEADIKVLAVGIGNPGETPIPKMRSGECMNEYIAVEGHTVGVPLRDDILKFIASETRGEYFGEGETQKLIQFLREEGLEMVSEESEFGPEHRRNIGQLFLIPATLALFGVLSLSANVRLK